jgi:hypothetical protein
VSKAEKGSRKMPKRRGARDLNDFEGAGLLLLLQLSYALTRPPAPFSPPSIAAAAAAPSHLLVQ